MFPGQGKPQQRGVPHPNDPPVSKYQSFGQSQGIQSFSNDYLNDLHYELEPTAKALAADGDKDMLELAATGKSFKLKICAAWAYGIRNEPSDNLLNLLMDENEVVSYAAKQSCVMIAKKFTGRDVNYGPHTGADADEKSDSRAMWELAFKKYSKMEAPKTVDNKTVNKVGNVRKRTVQEILGIE